MDMKRLRRMMLVVSSMMAGAAAAAPAQEIGVSSAIGMPGAFGSFTAGVEASLTGYSPGVTAARDGATLARPGAAVRITVAQHWSSEFREYRCASFMGCTYDPHRVRADLRLAEATVLVVPLQTRASRLETGLGASAFWFAGWEYGGGVGLTWSVVAARALRPGSNWWISLGYTWMVKGFQGYATDVENLTPPSKRLRAGLQYHPRRPRN
jgi:hypothetical protein